MDDEERKETNAAKRDLLDKALYIFDQDGTVYIDFTPLPGARELINHILGQGRGLIFISNNSSKSSSTYKNKLSELFSVELSKDNIYTSTSATIRFLRSQNITRIYAMGTPDFMEEMTENGFLLVEENPQIIVLAFDMTLTYEKLRKACLFIQNGIEYIATHPDSVCPMKDGYYPDIGSFIALLETATGRKPAKILGKPNPELILFLLEQFGLEPEDAIIFGDRMYTDIRMGNDCGITTALMLTGETAVEDIAQYDFEPDFIFRDLTEVLELMRRNAH